MRLSFLYSFTCEAVIVETVTGVLWGMDCSLLSHSHPLTQMHVRFCPTCTNPWHFFVPLPTTPFAFSPDPGRKILQVEYYIGYQFSSASAHSHRYLLQSCLSLCKSWIISHQLYFNHQIIYFHLPVNTYFNSVTVTSHPHPLLQSLSHIYIPLQMSPMCTRVCRPLVATCSPR